jgi:hypothetical protein
MFLGVPQVTVAQTFLFNLPRPPENFLPAHIQLASFSVQVLGHIHLISAHRQNAVQEL